MVKSLLEAQEMAPRHMVEDRIPAGAKHIYIDFLFKKSNFSVGGGKGKYI